MGSKRTRGRSSTAPVLATWLNTHFDGVPRVAPHAADRWTLRDADLSIELQRLEGDTALDALAFDCAEARNALAYPEHDANPICDFAVAWTRTDQPRIALALVELKGGLADDIAKKAEVQLRAVYDLLQSRLDVEAHRLEWHLVVVARKARSTESVRLDRDWQSRIGRGIIYAQVPRGRFTDPMNLRQVIAAAPKAA